MQQVLGRIKLLHAEVILVAMNSGGHEGLGIQSF